MARLLVVDDNPAVLSLTARILEGVGHFVLPVIGGALGIAAFDLHGYGIGAVVMDVAVPEVDGITAFQEIRRRRHDVPFLFLTGDAARLPGAVRVDARVAHLVKPFGVADLVATVNQVLALAAEPPAWALPSDLACPTFRLPVPRPAAGSHPHRAH